MNLFFDFDGVILDSLDIKEIGFRKIFSQYSDLNVNKLIHYHNQNLGKSRFIKIKYFYNQILKKEISSKKINYYANCFSATMKINLANKSKLIPKTINFIKKNYKKNKFFIVSGTEEKELIWLCKKLGINKFFYEICGSPTPKEKLIECIIKQYCLLKSNSALIGDSLNDYEAASYNKILFYGYNSVNLNSTKYNYISNLGPIIS
jgi:phosphoglycolate phosphatase-like HAD superfamily hydrolase|tara:strand:+ start:78 stop:692 length:615 start_codon:yes stop_codon:yes gene_type:complete